MTKCNHCGKFNLNIFEQEVYDTVKKKKRLTPLELAVIRDTTQSNANNILKKLSDNGLLKRTQRTQVTGGLEYEYTLNTTP